MSPGMQMAVVAIVSVFLGAFCVAIFRVSERQARGPVPAEKAAITPDEAGILAVLPGGYAVLCESGEVIRCDALMRSLGVIADGTLQDEEAREVFARVVRTGLGESLDVAVTRSAFTGTVHATLTFAPLPRDRVLIAARDRTEKVRLENTRRDFVQNISHELKTPIGALALLAETVRDSADDPDVVRRFAAQMQGEAARLNALVTDIIDLSTLEGTAASPPARPVPVSTIVTEASARVRVAADAAGVHVFAAPGPDAVVLGDQDLLVTALSNLLNNAVRYSDRDTRVTVSTGVDDHVVTIAVSDEGMGISPEAQARVFERFYRVDAARARAVGGTGLGLAIVKHICADHGGTIEVRSAPGLGSTFTITLPRAHETTGR